MKGGRGPHLARGQPRGGSEIGEQAAQFPLGIFVGLGDGELQGRFKQRPGFGSPPELEEQLSQENAGHHPVVLLSDADFEVGDGLLAAVRGDERLREAETEHLIAGMLCHQRLELFDP